MKLDFRKLNFENLEECLKLKHKLFPESDSDEDYQKYLLNKVKSEYFLVYYNNELVSITGWYDFDGKNENAFMGWFGVRQDYRNQGIGSEVFDFTLKRVKQHKYNYFRLYTDKVVNQDSIKLYTKKGMFIEPYTFDDAIGKNGNFVVFTKILRSNGHDLWDNKPLGEDDNYNNL